LGGLAARKGGLGTRPYGNIAIHQFGEEVVAGFGEDGGLVCGVIKFIENRKSYGVECLDNTF
jgi:hypothetical protein